MTETNYTTTNNNINPPPTSTRKRRDHPTMETNNMQPKFQFDRHQISHEIADSTFESVKPPATLSTPIINFGVTTPPSISSHPSSHPSIHPSDQSALLAVVANLNSTIADLRGDLNCMRAENTTLHECIFSLMQIKTATRTATIIYENKKKKIIIKKIKTIP